VLAEQLGLPIPAVPALIAVGALAGLGQLSFWTALMLAVLACLLSDTVWFWLGRKKGLSVLRTLCRLSLEPDTCVSIARDWFRKWGSSALLFAKFIPGFSTVAPPMAGVNRMTLASFLLADAAGSMAWAGAAMAAGYAFHNQLEWLVETLHRTGSWFGALLVAGLAVYIGLKWYQRHRLIHSFLMARITAEELQERLGSGEELVVVDLRGPLQVQSSGLKIPGAKVYTMSTLAEWHEEIPRDREIILYCA
jgi:membrane protein DedA with SNARE-associated domain